MKHTKFSGQAEYQSVKDVETYLLKGVEEEQQRSLLKQAIQCADSIQDEPTHLPSSVDIAFILKKLGVEPQTLIAALLTDPRFDERLSLLDIEDQFTPSVAALTKQVNWLNTFKEPELVEHNIPDQAEALRRMLLATVNDVRAVLVRLVYRVQRLRMLGTEPRHVQYAIARETLDIYTPLANRLGIGELKWEMEDLAFRYLEPEQYNAIAKSMDVNRTHREAIIDGFVDTLQDLFAERNIEARCYGRAKHLYSIWKKMQRKNQECHELADLLAVRVVVDSVEDCYQVLGLVHGLWRHLPEEFDDYIANTKENGYQSIHTAIHGPEQQVIEVQIRTKSMQQFAEYGVAAHWRYKEGSSQDQAMENTIEALRSLLEHPVADEQLLEQLKPDYLNDRVYVLTPKGEVVDLPPQATALDFAYFVHSEVGHHCIGATIDGQRVPLSYPLKSGERIEILTDPNSTPKLSWLSYKNRYFTTSRTAASVRSWLNNHYKDTDTAQLITSELVTGVGNREIIVSTCCQPKLGERIVGVYQSDTSVVVHSAECPNADKSKHEQPVLELEWGEKTNTIRQTIHIKAFDRQGLLQDLSTLMSQAQVNILQINSVTDTDDQSVSMDLLIEIGTEDELQHLFRRIEFIPNVFEASVGGE